MRVGSLPRTERILSTLKWLRQLAAPANEKAEFSRWINAHNTDTDQSEDWCTDCATSEVARRNEIHPDHEYFVDGGWGTQTDSPPYCCKCDKTLDDHLTGFAIKEELDHYSRHHVRATPESAFGFCQILDSADFNERDPAMWRFFLRLESMKKVTASKESNDV